MTLKNRTIIAAPLFLLCALIAAALLLPGVRHFVGPTPVAKAQSSNLGSLTGYAWSDDIGWVSFSGSTYQVVVQSDGTLAGYAWANPSDDPDGTNNVGWISFNAADTSGCGSAAKLSGLAITGWAKALSADNNGWDGCINLSGTASDSSSYGVSLLSTGIFQSGLLDGYAWGSSNVGWISFNCDTGGTGQANICATSNYGVTFVTSYSQPGSLAIASFYANPTHVRTGKPTTLYYTVTTPPPSCTITGSNGFSVIVVPVDGVQGSVATTNINSNTKFTLSCGSLSTTISVGVLPVYQEQ